MGIINDIFRTHAPEYLRRYGASIPTEHRKVLDAIIRCRTEACGSVVHRCENCDHAQQLFRGCGNRHCPGCQNHKTRQWLARQLERQLPGHHFMLTFTVPEQLRPFMRSHQRSAYRALFAASSAAIKKLAGDARFMGGGIPGFFGVLHTWGRQLQYHPHIHYVVPGGVLSSSSGAWHPSSPGFYLPVKALSRLFRGIFRDLLDKEGLLSQVPPEVWKLAWNVNSQAVGCSEASIKYLAPYVFRVAISDSRIISASDGRVRFRYKQRHSNRLRTMELDALEFIRRFLQHVLPTGLMKVRYYGFLSPTSSASLEEVRARIELAYGFELTESEPQVEPLPMRQCPHCGGALKYYGTILPPGRYAGLSTPPS